jgi:hypothetical protein
MCVFRTYHTVSDKVYEYEAYEALYGSVFT